MLLARIGIHTGECILEKNDIFGDVVNTASRFESSANPGEILISEDTYNALSDKSEFYARFDREVTLKGKSMPFNAYIVFWDPKEVERDRNRPVETAPVKQADARVEARALRGRPGDGRSSWPRSGSPAARSSRASPRRTIEHSLDAKK